jgi:hypothetical protein
METNHGLRSIRRFAISNGLCHGQPDIGYSQPTDHASNEAVRQELTNIRVGGNKRVAGPERRPWRDRQYDADLQTEENEDDEEDSASPNLPSPQPLARLRHY